MERELFPLHHFSMRAGHIGRLQTLSCIPVVAGDSMNLNVSGPIRLSQHRRESVSEAQVDVHVFYVKHRHIYGEAWNTMIKQGYDSPGSGLTGYSIPPADRAADFLGVRSLSAATPKWLVDGYNFIWRNYYRVPHLDDDADNSTYPTAATAAGQRHLKYGRLCARLPHFLNSATRVGGGSPSWRDLAAGDFDVAAGATLDIRDLARVQGEARSEINATWKADRYRDVMREDWGTTPNIDADQRPELLWEETFLMSGMDVDGTDEATLGSYVGKAAARLDFSMPDRFFEEHGALWVMALVRFPLIHQLEAHPLTQVDITHLNTVAKPDQWAAMPPEGENTNVWFAGSGGAGSPSTTYQKPFGQHYRFHPSHVHTVLDNTAGYPWQPLGDASGVGMFYHTDDDYSWVFNTQQFGHWQCSLRVECDAKRRIPSAGHSLYVGV